MKKSISLKSFTDFYLEDLRDQREWIFMFNLVYNLVASNNAVLPDYHVHVHEGLMCLN